MDKISAEQLLAAALTAKERQRKELAALSLERKLALVDEMIAISRRAGQLPDWYYRLFPEYAHYRKSP
jgi:hypothetical protein